MLFSVSELEDRDLGKKIKFSNIPKEDHVVQRAVGMLTCTIIKLEYHTS
jgi:hypothetical protein